MISKLLIITTGGTIDKIYFDDQSDYQIGEPQISQILQTAEARESRIRRLQRSGSGGLRVRCHEQRQMMDFIPVI